MRLKIIFTGIGGQGIIFSSRLFSELGRKMGLGVMGSETHGMSQRGGSVIAHLKLGEFWSPLIRKGTADFLFSFEESETYRNLSYLRKGGVCFTNLILRRRFNEKVLNNLKKKRITFVAYDASQKASRIGLPMFSNMVLIGYSLGTGLLPFAYHKLRAVLEEMSPAKHKEMNLRSLEAGYREGKRKWKR